MGAMMSCLALISGALAAVLLGLIKDEAAAWLPRLIDRVLIAASSRLRPIENRNRYYEEWSAHVAEYPGKLSQLLQAALCFQASFRLTPIDRREKYFAVGNFCSHIFTALTMPSFYDYLFSADQSKHISTYIWLIGLAFPFTAANVILDRYLYRKKWLYHRRSRTS